MYGTQGVIGIYFQTDYYEMGFLFVGDSGSSSLFSLETSRLSN